MGKTPPQFDFKDIVSINMKIMNFFGVIPPSLDSTLDWIVYVFRATTLLAFFFGGLLAIEFGYMYKHYGNIDEMVSASFLTLANIVTTILYFFIYIHRERIGNLVESINRTEFQPKTIQQQDMLLSYIRTSKTITLSLQVACGTTCIFWGVYPYTVSGGPFLPTAGYIPYNTDYSPVFEITFVYEFIAVLCSGVMNTGALSLIEGLIMVVGAELRTLNDSLANLKEYSANTIGIYGRGYCELVSEELDKKMVENLIDCLIKHKYVIGFLDEISLIFGKALLVQYLIIVLMLCTALFEMTKVPVGSVPFFSYVCFQYCSVTGIFVLCYFGNEVIVESTRLTSSAYSCDWTGCSQTFKKLLLVFMIRSQKGLELYAANIFSISLENFLKIMKSAVSYFTILQQFSDEMA